MANLLGNRPKADNEADELNPSQQASDAEFARIAKAEELANLNASWNEPYEGKNGNHVDAHGDEIQDNYNADDPNGDREHVKGREEAGDEGFSYNKGDGATSRWQKLVGQLQTAGLNTGASGSVVGLLLVGLLGVGGGTTTLAGSLLVNIKEVFHNDRADASRTNKLFARAFLGNKLNNNSGCTGSKIKCKISTMTKAQIKKYVSEGKFAFKGVYVDTDGKDTSKKIEDDKTLDPDSANQTDQSEQSGGEDQRARITEIRTPPDEANPKGKWFKNTRDLFGELDTNVRALRAAEQAFSSKASFYTNKFFSNVLKDKFGFSKAKKTFPSDETANTEEERNKIKQAQDEALNKEVDGLSDADKSGEKLKAVVSDLENKSSEHIKTEDGSKGGKGGAVLTAISSICSVYKLSNAATTAVKLYHGAQLAKFALLFLQAADEIKDGRGDGSKVTYLANNLTSYVKDQVVGAKGDLTQPNLKPGDKNPKYNLSATDSQGYRIAAMGDQSKLTEFAKNYLLGGNGVVQGLDTFNNAVESVASNVPTGNASTPRQKAKTVCRMANGNIAALVSGCLGVQAGLQVLATGWGDATLEVGRAAMAALGVGMCACSATSVASDMFDENNVTRWLKDRLSNIMSVLSLGKKAAANIMSDISPDAPGKDHMVKGQSTLNPCTTVNESILAIQDAAIALLKSQLARGYFDEILKKIAVGSDTKGVDAGNAIAAGAGVMLSTTSSGYGLKPASAAKGADGNNQDITDYISYTQPLEDTYIALDKEDARQNPLDATNQYSLMGNVVRSLNLNVDSSDSLFGSFSIFSSIIPTALRSLTTGQSASALYNQPSTAANGNSGRYQCTDDEDLTSIGATGDAFCDIVNVTPKNELDFASEQAYTPGNQNINNLADRMTTQLYKDSSSGLTIGCTTTEGAELGCDQTELASIDENGAPIKNSQYDKYLTYCTDKRTAPWGAQSAGYEEGTDRDQRWYSGEECMFDITRPDSYKNGGGGGMSSQEEAKMVSDFRMWTNVCLQSGTADGSSNCYTDDYDTNVSALASVSTGDCKSDGNTKNIYTCALKYDNYRYKWGGGHGDVPNATQWIKDFNAGKVPEWTQILDCSGLVRMAFVEAMGIEDAAYTAPDGFATSKYWQKIPLTDAQQGDIVTSSGHVAIVESNDPASKTYRIFDAETETGEKEANIRHSTQDYGKTIAAYRAKKTP